MEFRLTYAGPLSATQGNEVGGRAKRQHKHDIRKRFHPQLKQLREITPFLKTGERSGPSTFLLEESPDPPRLDIESLAAKYGVDGWNFVPLVTEELNLICELDILLLRPQRPGKVISAGDLDNRLKTLVDALRIPKKGEGYADLPQESDEKPFHCLLADDSIISKVSIETDQLLELLDSRNSNDVRLVITVRLRPYEMNLWNLPFG
jgi:hypothetical protein